ncbi:MAG: hypothetical protein Q4E88_06825 [Coriobacteriia bacterium]|nr:hypothetical protein [Coriobacteriia bacterium]
MQVDKLKDNKRSKYQKPGIELINFDYNDIIATSVCGSDGCPTDGECTFVVCNGDTCTFVG